MPFFQNMFDKEFRGSLCLGDRQYSINYTIKGNQNSGSTMMCYVPAPWNLSTLNTLTFNYAVDPTLKQFQTMSINVAGSTPAVTQAYEVVNALNADPVFSGYYVASARNLSGVPNTLNNQGQIVLLQSIRPNIAIRCYVVSGTSSSSSAEQVMKFNLNAPIAQLPSYFARETVANSGNFSDSYGGLIQLDPTDTYTQTMIRAQNQDPTTVLADWQLLAGNSGLFMAHGYTYDGSGRLLTDLAFSTGSGVGSLAMKTFFQYSGASVNPSQSVATPYVLTSGDILTP